MIGWKGLEDQMMHLIGGEKQVFHTSKQEVYWKVLELLARNQIQHRGDRRDTPTESIYRVFVKRRDADRALQFIDMEEGLIK